MTKEEDVTVALYNWRNLNRAGHDRSCEIFCEYIAAGPALGGFS